MMQSRTRCLLIGSFAAGASLLLGCQTLLAQVQPAKPSYSSSMSSGLLVHQFGTFRQGAPSTTLDFAVFNLPATVGTTSPMSLVGTHPFGDIPSLAAITIQTGTVSGLQPVGTGGTPNAPMQLNLSTSQIGSLQVSYTLEFSSDSLPTAPHESLAIAAYATILRHGDYNADGKVDAADYVVWRKTRGQSVSPAFSQADDNGDSHVTDADYNAWRSAFTGDSGSGSSDLFGPMEVPEPCMAVLGFLGALFAAMPTRKRIAA